MGSLTALLRKELRWGRRNAGTLVVLLLVLPATFAVGTVAFQQVIPRDTPVAVAPGESATSPDELGVVSGAVTAFSTPREYDSADAARDALRREEVYGVLLVPHGLFEADQSVEIVFLIDRTVVPYETPSVLIAQLARRALGPALPADVSVTRQTIGADRTLSAYLLPVTMMLVTLILGLVYLPHTLIDERGALDRLRVTTSLTTVIAGKLVFFGTGLTLALGVGLGVGEWLGYGVFGRPLVAVGVYLTVFLFTAAVGVSVALATGFADGGRVLNVGLLFLALLGSNLVYPAGFFSPLRLRIARASPIHHGMIVVRSALLKDASLGLFGTSLSILVAATLAGLVALGGTIRLTEH